MTREFSVTDEVVVKMICPNAFAQPEYADKHKIQVGYAVTEEVSFGWVEIHDGEGHIIGRGINAQIAWRMALQYLRGQPADAA
jgi:hypothetical protein